MTRFASLGPMLTPGSVAVVGASAERTRIGGRPIDTMLRQGFAGPIYPVNPKHATIQGLRAYPAIADLPAPPDVAIVAVPAASAVQVVEELGVRGTKAVVMFTAGFAETGTEADVAAQDRLAATAARHGMRLLGPNCIGLCNARTGFCASFSTSFETGWPLPGRIGIASQSGAYGTHVGMIARRRGIGAPLLVTTGNEADVTLGDVIGWMVEDPDTDVIAAYAEGFREPGSLLAALAAARAARKPVVMMKVGSSGLGRRAASSHTASLAGDDAVAAAVMAEFGVVRARSTEEMLDIAHLATRRVYPARNTLGVITISGGAGVLIADAAAAAGLPMPEMPAAAQARLRGLVPFASAINPIDCTAQAFNDITLMGRFTDAMLEEGGYSSVLGFFTMVGGSPSIAPRLREQLVASRGRHPDRLYVLSLIGTPELVDGYEQDGFTVMEDPTRAVAAIDAMGRFGAAFARPPAGPPLDVPAVTLPDATPDEAAAKRLLAQAGIAVVEEHVCATAAAAAAAAASFGYPVVMKLVAPGVSHKSELGGVLMDVADAAAVADGFARLMAIPGATAVLVARQLKGGVECILGVQQDPVFGPVALVGLGGVFVEVLQDVALRRCPFGVDAAVAMIHSLRGAPLLLGARGRPPVDVAALAEMLSRLSAWAVQAGPRLLAVDLNPVIVRPDGAWAVDAVIDLQPCS